MDSGVKMGRRKGLAGLFTAVASTLCLVLVVVVFVVGINGSQGTGATAADVNLEVSDVSATTSADDDDAPSTSEEPDGESVDPDEEEPGYLDSNEISESWDASQCRSGEVLVQLAEDVTADELNEQLAGLGFVSKSEVLSDDESVGWVKLEVTGDESLEAQISALKSTDVISDAQPNFVYNLLEDEAVTMSAGDSQQAQLAVGSSNLFAQGAINDAVALKAENDWWLRAVGAFEAWEKRKTLGSVTVAVIDTGCAVSHEDLSSVVSAGNCYNALTGATGFAAVNDVDGHGTHVAGIISAVPNNRIGIAGVSYGARIMPIKAVDKKTTDTSCIIKAYNFIMKKRKAGVNVRVVNMSLGGSAGYDAALMRAIDKAYYEYGILSVFAAGNSGELAPYYCFPCDYSEVGLGVISVGKSTATTKRGTRNSSSNYNVGSEKTKALSAPGVEIVSTYPVSLSKGGTFGEGYYTLSGTSMAAPIVSGIAALAWAQNPSLTAGEMRSLLCSTATDIRRSNGSGSGFDAYTGYGLVRADKAVANARTSYLKGRDAVAKGSSIKLQTPQSGSWSWSSDNTAVARVNASGNVTGRSAGEAVISAINSKTKTKLSKTIVVYDAQITGSATVKAGKKKTLSLNVSPLSMCTWTSSDTSIASIGATTGRIKGKKVGTVIVRARLTAAPHVVLTKKVRVTRGPNTMVVTSRTKTVRFSDVKKKSRKVTGAVYFTREAKGRVTYSKVAKKSSSKLSINKKTGTVTVAKGTKRGTYKMKVKVRASGNASYNARIRYVTVVIKVQ